MLEDLIYRGPNLLSHRTIYPVIPGSIGRLPWFEEVVDLEVSIELGCNCFGHEG